MVAPVVKRGDTEVERIWIPPPGARCVSGERISGTGCSWKGDQNCAQSEGSVGEEVYQRLESSAQAAASVSYFGRNLGHLAQIAHSRVLSTVITISRSAISVFRIRISGKSNG